MSLTKEKLLEMLLNTLVDSHYQQLFPVRDQNEWANLGYTASTKRDSKIFHLLNVLSKSLEDQLIGYEKPEPKKERPPSKQRLKFLEKQRQAKEREDIERQRQAKEREDIERQRQLEESWRLDKPRADKEEKENAERLAQAIFDKNQELKKTRG